MTDLRKAAEMALEAFEMYLQHSTKEMIFNQIATARAKALRQALDYPTPEQIALAQQIRPKGKSRIGQALAQPEQEPFIYVREDTEKPFGGYEHCSEVDAGAFPVYTAPPKREWQGLTGEEREKATGWSVDHIETKLKEKNT